MREVKKKFIDVRNPNHTIKKTPIPYGRNKYDWPKCHKCYGKGKILVRSEDKYGEVTKITCPDCGGDGVIKPDDEKDFHARK